MRFVVECEQTFVASFVRAEDGGALTGGELHYLIADAEDRHGAFLTAGETCASLDAQGAVAMCMPTGHSSYRLLHSPGRAPTILATDEVTAPGSPPNRFALERSATLVLRVVDRESPARPNLVISFACAARSLVAHEQGTGETLGTAVLDWSAPIDTAGASRIDDLPVHVPLEMRVGGGHSFTVDQFEPLILDPGEVRELTIEIGAVTQLTVSVFDEHEHAIAGCAVGVTQHGIDVAAGQERALVLPGDQPDFQHQGRTDDHGQWMCAALPPGVWWVCLAPTRAPWDEFDANAVAPVAQRIEILANEAQRELTVHTTRGLYLRGRVEVPDGLLFPPGAQRGAMPNVVLITHSVAPGSTLTGQPELDGSFAIGPLLEGEYVIETFARQYAPIEPLRVHTGGDPIVIRMQLGAALSGHVVDAASGNGVQCDVVITKLAGATPEMLGSTDGQGFFGFSGLAAGEYAISAFARDGRTGMAARQHVEAGDAQGDIPLRLEPLANCGQVRMVLEGAIAPGRITLWQDGVCRALYFVDGAMVETVAAPAGELEARLIAGQDLVETRKLSVLRGETAEVRIRR